MRRLACKIFTAERRVGHKLIALAERQRPFLDSHLPPDWSRRFCTYSIAHEQESEDYVDVTSTHLTNCKRETSNGAVGTRSMADSDAHLTNCSRDSAVDYLGMPGMPDTGAESSLDKGTGRVLDMPNMKLGDEFLEHVDDGSTMSAPDCMEECWDEALEQAILDASDSCMHNKSVKDFSEVNPEVEVAMSDLRAECSYMDKRKDEVVDGPASNTITNGFRSVCTQSRDIKVETMERPKQDSFDGSEALKVAADFNVYQSSSHLEEGFVIQNDKEDMDKFSDDDDWSFEIPLKFSKRQMEVLEVVACGKSVFITGSAGTGKSFLLMYIIRVLKKALPENSVYVTASTGIAACALKGITLHAFAGIGMGSGTESSLATRVLRSKDSVKRWKEAAVLIIDEISMIDGELFDKLEFIARRVRGSTECFGGIQLIVTGDFFQLPPVSPPNLQKYFAFQADCWNRCFHMQVELEHVFRQSDSVFVKMLNEIRKGVHTSETLGKLDMCLRALPDDGTGIVPTRLYPLKVDVRQENMQELMALQTSIVTFDAVDSQKNRLHRYAFANMRCEEKLQLCVGAQVMLCKNLDTKNGLVNGAKGIVTGFQSQYKGFSEGNKDDKAVKGVSHLVSPAGYWPMVRFDCGTKTIGPSKECIEDGGVEVASRIQVPLILAWALSVHKCQGMTLSKVQTDLSKAFDFGMVYVALSRVKDLDGLQLVGYDPTRIKAHPNVVAFSNRMLREFAS